MVSFGELRKIRIFNLTVIDLVPTFIAAFIVHLVLWLYPLEMKDKEKRSVLQYMVSLALIFTMFLGLGVIFHRIFGIKSALSGYLGFNDMPIIN